MAWATRLTDVCTGHSCYPPRPSITGSPDVFTNNLNQMRLTDLYAVHCCSGCHGGYLAAGSGSVFVNNLPAGREGDAVSCGGAASNHSPDVDIGD